MSKFGPTRSELRFRLWFSLAGIAFMVGGILVVGLPQDFVGFEVLVIATLFFGGTFVWTVRKLARKDYPDAE